jgi:hypothetical protein
MGKTGPLIDLTIKRRHREFFIALQTPGHRVRKERQGDCTSLTNQRRPKLLVLRAKGTPKKEGVRRDWQSKHHRDVFVRADVEEPWESAGKWSISHPPISPETDFLPIFNMVFSSQLKEVLNFINVTPELRTSLTSCSKDVIRVKVFGLQKFEPKRVMFRRVRKSPNPFCH